jgi:outer membrane protein OmpA-like peptidoglycan-associated protein
LSKYQRRLRLQGIIAATLLAEVTVFSAVKFAEAGAAPARGAVILGPIFLTTIVLAGISLAGARGRTEWQADLLMRYLSRTDGGLASPNGARLTPDMSIQDAAQIDNSISTRSPAPGNSAYTLALLVTLAAAILLLFYVWVPVISPAIRTEKQRVEIVGLPVSVYFDVDRAVVPESMRPQLEILARRMAALQNGELLLEGYADSDYRSEYNLELSRLRAEAVKKVLVLGGLDAGRITVVGFGETRPLAHEASPAGKAQNRRVDISLLARKGVAGDFIKPSP